MSALIGALALVMAAVIAAIVSIHNQTKVLEQKKSESVAREEERREERDHEDAQQRERHLEAAIDEAREQLRSPVPARRQEGLLTIYLLVDEFDLSRRPTLAAQILAAMQVRYGRSFASLDEARTHYELEMKREATDDDAGI